MRKHVDKRIDTEKINFPTNQVTDTRLGDPYEGRRFSLRQLTVLYQLAEVSHQR